MECLRFRTYLRSLEFVSQSLEEYGLNENLKDFSYLAKQARRDFIVKTFINKNNPLLFRPIPITQQEAEAQNNEEKLKRPEILVKIKVLLEQLSEDVQKKYTKLESKNRGELLNILQEVKYLFNSDEFDNESSDQNTKAN